MQFFVNNGGDHYIRCRAHSTAGNNNFLILAQNDMRLHSGSSETERLRIASDGEVFIGDGIGTTDRNTVLSVSGGNQDPGGAWSTMGIYSSDSQAENKGGSLLFGGQDGTMISNFIDFHMRKTLNWSLAAAMGGVLLVIVLFLYWI